jgi:hypothetical protein
MRHVLLASCLALACAATPENEKRDVLQYQQAEDGIADASSAHDSIAYDRATIDDYGGSWESISDDGTSIETADIETSNGTASGLLKSVQRGYFSGRTSVNARIALSGRMRAGALDIRLWDADQGESAGTMNGRAFRRGEYLIIRANNREAGYARPGVPLVKSAEGSRAAEQLANAVGGKIFSSNNQAQGRGAFVGGRVRLALCSDGTIAYDASDLASTGGADGVDMGSSTSRRGRWGVVLLAGTPAVRAEWNGTGTSYSLTRYIQIEPTRNNSAAKIDGNELGVSGKC